MTNTGTWNSDFALLFLFAFLSPIVLFFAAGVFLKILEIYLMIDSHRSIQLEPEERSVEPQEEKVAQPKEPEQDSSMYLDAVDALSGLGYKKSEARRIISKALNQKDYKNAEDIISDVISSVY